MIPSFKPGIMSSNRIRKAAAGDVTPDAIAGWCNAISKSSYFEDCVDKFTAERITGIDTTITLKVEYANSSMQLWLKKNNTTNPSYSQSNFCDTSSSGNYFFGGNYNYAANGWTQLNNNDTFTAVNNDWISFGASRKSGTGYASEAVTLKNVSDGNAVIGTFNAVDEAYC